MKHRPHTAARERAGRKLTATDPSTTESTNAASGNKDGSEAAAKDNADMSMDVEIGIVSDADEYSIDQSHVDGGADDDLQKVFAGRPSEDYYWRTHPDKDNEPRTLSLLCCPRGEK